MKQLLSYFSAMLLFVFSASTAKAQCNFNVEIRDSLQCDSMAYLHIPMGMPYDTILWSNGASFYSTQVPRVVGATYTVSVTYNACTVIDTFVIGAIAPSMSVSLVVTQNCGVGNADLTVSGGTAPYTYYWWNGETTQDIQNLTNSTNVQITDARGCSQFYTANILPANNFNVNLIDSSSCGDSLARLTALPSPFFAGATYRWSTGATTQSIFAVRNMFHLVTVTNPQTNCRYVASITTPSQANSVMTFSAIVIQNCGLGNINLTVSGGVAPYTYAWSNGATTEDVLNLPIGGNVLVRSANGCTQSYTPNIFPANNFSVNVIDSSSCGDVLARLTALASPSFAGATYRWSNGATTQNILAARNMMHRVTVTNPQTNCRSIVSITTPSQASTLLSLSSTVAQNCGASNGNVDLTVSSGIAPYTYAWSNGATTQDVQNVPYGTSVIVTSADGCTEQHFPNISPLTSVQLQDSLPCDSMAYLYIPINTPYDTILWSNGSQNSTNIQVPRVVGATYAISVTYNGCTVVDTFVIGGIGSSMSVSAIVTQNCGLGNVDLSVSGGVAPYTYAWSNGATTQDVQNVTNNTWVQITDANGCMTTYTANILPANNFSVNLIDSSSCGDTLAHLMAFPSPFFAGATYRWSNGATTQSTWATRNTFHLVTVTNPQTNCMYVASTTTPSQATGSLLLSSVVVQNCGLGNVDLSVSGGVAPYTYDWSNGATTQDVQNVSDGTSVFVTSANGCTGELTVSIVDTSSFTVGIIDSSNCSDSLLMLIADVYPYLPTLNYLWSDGSTAMAIYDAQSGSNYSVTVTDWTTGCSVSANITTANITATAMSVSSIITRSICSGNGLGAAVDLTVTGGQAPYQYYWSNGEVVEDAQNLLENDDVFIVDNRGCSAYHMPNIVGGIDIYDYIVASTCNQNDGSITLIPTDSATYTYQWSNGATTGSENLDLSPGWYGVTVTRANPACILVRDFYVGNSNNCQTTLTGQVFNASSTGACSANLPYMTSGWISLRNVASGQIFYVGVSNGRYTLRTILTGTYTLSYYNYVNTNAMNILCPSNNLYTITLTSNGGTINSGDFYVTYDNQVDAAADMYAIGAVPGLSFEETFSVCNYGVQPISGTITYNYDAQLSNPMFSTTFLTLVSQNTANNTATFSYSNIASGVCQNATAEFMIPTNMALGTILNSSVSVTQAGDNYLDNNQMYWQTTVASSYDPNDKRMMRHRTGDEFEGGIYVDDNQLEYIIRFQNTGTAPARRVVVRDTLETNLLPETINELLTSHNGTAHIEDNNVFVMTFDNIYLPEASVDLEGSQGYIKFNIMRTAGLPIGTSIRNRAAIYFDYNAPIITNTTISTLEQEIVSVENLTNALQVQVMPNPFDAILTAEYELQNQGKVSIRLYNALGQVALESNIGTQTAGQHNISLSTAQLSSGIYWLQIESSEGKYTQKVIKQ